MDGKFHRHRPPGKSSSSVHDGVRNLVMGMATFVVAVVLGITGFLLHGYGLI